MSGRPAAKPGSDLRERPRMFQDGATIAEIAPEVLVLHVSDAPGAAAHEEIIEALLADGADAPAPVFDLFHGDELAGDGWTAFEGLHDEFSSAEEVAPAAW